MAVGLAVGLAVLAGVVTGALPAAAPPRLSGERLQFVDCLLPGQLRKLGGQVMFLGPRRPTRATVEDCEIRGGEYVAFDRADYGSALQVWLPQAEKGDADSQVYVGEIYERGAGAAPDYPHAAEWYGKAAAAGNVQGKMHLAYLYEQGLGVPQDTLHAVNLYREAAGLTNDHLILSSELEAREAEFTTRLQQQIEALQKAGAELDHSREELQNQSDGLAKEERVAAGLRARLAALQREKTPAGAGQEIAALQREIAERDQHLEDQRRAIADLQQTSKQQGDWMNKQLADTEREKTRLESQLGAATTQAASLRTQIAALKARAEALGQAAGAAREELKKSAQAATQAGRKSDALTPQQRSQLALAQGLEEERNRLTQQVQKLQESLATASSTAKESNQAASSLRAQLVSLESERATSARTLTELSLRVQGDARDLAGVRTRLTQAEGRLSAQDEQLQKLAAERDERESSLEKERAVVKGLEASIQTDQAQIAELRAQLNVKGVEVHPSVPVAPEPARPALPPRPVPSLPPSAGTRDLGLGNSYALIIANSRYRDASYTPLPSVAKDAEAVEGALERYGFKGHTVHIDNGSRDTIMNALASFGAQLGPNDSALIYYSGHGALLEANNATYWMPSDADPANPGTWVSTAWVTEMIGQMHARHVLVVVDSCYAGAMVHNTNLRLASRSPEAEPERLHTLAQLRSRTVLTSGGNEPVAGSGPGGNSVFARQFTQILDHNTGVLDGSSLYDSLSDAMSHAPASPGASATQLPRYSVLANTNHLNGDFLFVPGGHADRLNPP